ncbi:amiloride-sensitive sodium channel-related [Holotrichia oblita]|uniref:Amiloride-sensitive sodium channel-related n=1 Tax=Holotrichia oblita TaxID=644536 RepID=A0ACB9SJ84_HOLOL|nr:amiloride-sensitive sodium channel-related [Holotrichia oblita]
MRFPPVKTIATVVSRAASSNLTLAVQEAPKYLNTFKEDVVYKKINDINKWYTKIIGLDEVKLYQDRVFDLQQRLLNAQEKRREVGLLLSEIRKKSNELQDQIHKVKRQDDLQKFLDLMKEETEMLKQEKDVSEFFTNCDREEREIFSAFTNAIRDSHEKQRAQLEYTKYFGLILSIAGSFLAFTYSTLRKNDLKNFIEKTMADLMSPQESAIMLSTPLLQNIQENQKKNERVMEAIMHNHTQLMSAINKSEKPGPPIILQKPQSIPNLNDMPDVEFTMLGTLRQYLLNTSFHGFRFLAERDLHWTEKIFWLVCCAASWYGSTLLILASWDDFQHNAISFVAETDYLDWNTTFPSVVICETDNSKKMGEVTDRLYGDPHDYNIDEIIKELVYFRGLSFYTLQMCGSDAVPNPDCITKNFSIYSELVRGTCDEIMQNCKWNDESFDCCKYFVPLDTELGTCYAINSKQSRDGKAPRLEMISNKDTGPGTLYFELFGNANVFIIGEQEVPSLTTLQTDILQVSPHIHFYRSIAINEIDNQPEVKYVNVAQRNCRFMEESEDIDVYRYYSYSTCCVQCRKMAQLKTCGCVHHLTPRTPYEMQCTIEGLECLNDNYNNLAVLKASWSNRSGLVCECLPSCTELEIELVRDIKTGTHEEYAIVEISLDRLPSERFKRNVIKGKLDLVVSMGGTAGLFIGASILSFVEILYYFIIRPINDYFIGRQQNGNEDRVILVKSVQK